MKKFSTGLLVLFVSALLLTTFTACDKLKVNNLKANYHLKSANKFYTDEKYAKAIKEYEEALKYNPKLEQALFYLGTSYAMIYKPGDESEKNKANGENAKKYLEEALKQNSEKKEIIMALGDIFDKMSDFSQAETYYLKLLQSDSQNPKAYYVLANFYSKYEGDTEKAPNAKEKAIEMFEKRIALNPEDPDGYNYLANYYKDKRNYEKAIENYNKRIALLDKTNLSDKEKKLEQSISYYTIGVILWGKSYNTPEESMSPQERIQVVTQGMENLQKAADLDPSAPDPWAYMSLLYRERAKAEPGKKNELVKKADELIAKFQELRKRKMATEEYMKNLEKENK